MKLKTGIFSKMKCIHRFPSETQSDDIKFSTICIRKSKTHTRQKGVCDSVG